VTPCAIKYSLPGGLVSEEICYWGQHVIGPHLFHLLGKTDIGAALTFGEPVTPTSDRKELARDLRAQLIDLRSGERSRSLPEMLTSIPVQRRRAHRAALPNLAVRSSIRR
jgi:hypothetical protein